MSIERADLINQLAASMGAGQFAATKFEQSRYDAETGTLYCKGMAISSNVADEAVKYFTTLKNKCSYDDPATKHMALIYQCAIESIKMFQNPKIKDFLRGEGADILNA
ncbi:hypothetical protein [Butyrivibrio sp. YAB3001]|uniref:hypothetical protein n=1 Tax=Butyrivibrio sp. YAB3001 TaxID=1520812 RepID=UPI0008F68BCA|nr:hypothetical protein [Butyrivibrio sp. YAB3001]SFC90732.1 hypothetical protein SAMN02910398_03492 [Butyrivibrio sp. YAB3001]